MKRDIPEEDIQIINKHIKKWSTSSAIMEMQTKATMIYYYTPIRMVGIKKQKMPNT